MVIVDPPVVDNEEPPQYSEPYQPRSYCRLVHDEDATLDTAHAFRIQGLICEPLSVASRITVPGGERVQVLHLLSRKIDHDGIGEPVDQKFAFYRVTYLLNTICNLLLDLKNEYSVSHAELQAESKEHSAQTFVVGQICWVYNSRTQGLQDETPVVIRQAPKVPVSTHSHDINVLRYAVAPLTPTKCALKYIINRKLGHEELSSDY